MPNKIDPPIMIFLVVALTPGYSPRGWEFSNRSYPPSLGVNIEVSIEGVNTVKKIQTEKSWKLGIW